MREKIPALTVPLWNEKAPRYNAENYVPRVTYRPVPLTRFAGSKPVRAADKHATASHFFGIGVLSAE